MTDPLEITRNPGNDFRCSAHEELVRMTMSIEGDMKAMRVKVESLDEKVDRMDGTMRVGFSDVKESLRAMQSDRSSDVKGLGHRLDSQDTKLVSIATRQSEGGGAARLLMWLIPILIGVIIAVAGFLI